MVFIYILNYFVNVLKIYFQSKYVYAFIGFITILLAAVVVGTRPLDAGFDTKGYIEAYNSLDKSLLESFLIVKHYFGVSIEPLFWGYAWGLSKIGVSPSGFLFITAFISILLTSWAYRKVDPDYYYLSFLGVIFSGSFINLYGNAIRQGLAIPFFLMAFFHFLHGENRKVILYGIITFLLHQYTGILVMLFYLIRFVPFRFYIGIWLGCFFLAFVIKSGILSSIPGFSTYAKGSSFAYLVHPTFLEFPIYYFFLIHFKLLNDNYLRKLFEFIAVVFLLQTLFIFNIYSYNRVGMLRFLLEPIIYTRIIFQLKPVKASKQVLLLIFFLYGLSIYLSEAVQTTLSSTPS
ncbi:EpsG family protein [Chitinophaga polysaccharea]|uniref:EpsG family protein n=1 Tax=Chitinophaga polysaccharea TaxID=1293035 RepID=UPI0014551F8A|nr:EpsG family protein [Chitinophaga polysaccharea]NLR61866.1 EpsG family protein [Chitinophaga polysaccharea]